MQKASLVVLMDDTHILIGKNKSGPFEGKFNVPGGKCRRGERPVTCAIREIKEEVRIDLGEGSLHEVAIITFYASGMPYQKVYVFRASAWGGDSVETDSMQPAWWTKDDLPFNRMLEADRHWFGRIVAGERFNATVYYEEPGKGFKHIEFTS